MACQVNSAELTSPESLDPYVQDALDLIQFANDSTDTKWGALRAALGHPTPFHLKMLGVGNENFGPLYMERFTRFQAAIQKDYPKIKLIGSTGLFSSGEIFDSVNTSLRKMEVAFVDEHNYNSPEWFLQNAGHYDNYERNAPTKVFVGEYAGQSIGMTNTNNKNNWRSALAEAAYMTGLERNAAVVQMASYAPLLAHTEGWQWKPDLIWFNNLNVMATPNYYVQQLFSVNKGSAVVPIFYKDNRPSTGMDSLYASATTDKLTNELIVKIVNAAGYQQSSEIIIQGAGKTGSKAKVLTLQNNNPEAENTIGSPGVIVPLETTIDLQKQMVKIKLDPYSFTVIRVKL
jgi:alpha-L-arabinofuranosidase